MARPWMTFLCSGSRTDYTDPLVLQQRDWLAVLYHGQELKFDGQQGVGKGQCLGAKQNQTEVEHPDSHWTSSQHPSTRFR